MARSKKLTVRDVMRAIENLPLIPLKGDTAIDEAIHDAIIEYEGANASKASEQKLDALLAQCTRRQNSRAQRRAREQEDRKIFALRAKARARFNARNARERGAK